MYCIYCIKKVFRLFLYIVFTLEKWYLYLQLHNNSFSFGGGQSYNLLSLEGTVLINIFFDLKI